jgi:hypothetical protein
MLANASRPQAMTIMTIISGAQVFSDPVVIVFPVFFSGRQAALSPPLVTGAFQVEGSMTTISGISNMRL